MYCQRCGADNGQKAKYCKKCGYAMSPEDTRKDSINHSVAEESVATKQQSAGESKYCGVRGFLLLFCIYITVIYPLVVAFGLIGEINAFQPSFEYYQRLLVAVVLQGITRGLLIAFSIYAGICLWTRKRNAPRTAQAFLWATLAFAIINPLIYLLVSDLPDNAKGVIVSEGIKQAIGAVIPFTFWSAYLNMSKRVKATYA